MEVTPRWVIGEGTTDTKRKMPSEKKKKVREFPQPTIYQKKKINKRQKKTTHQTTTNNNIRTNKYSKKKNSPTTGSEFSAYTSPRPPAD